MADGDALARAPRKFLHPDFTADGSRRAAVAFRRLETVWVNTGTLCNIECAHCYLESGPKNDRLAYITPDEIAPFLREARLLGGGEVGFTGGEPFMNPHMIALAGAALEHGFKILVLTNAMRPMMRPSMQKGLLTLLERYGGRLCLRVSLDHYSAQRHDQERGPGGFAETLKGLDWLARNGFSVSVAGRSLWDELQEKARAGYAALFKECGLPINSDDPMSLVIFPEMDETLDTPEITTACWSMLGKSPDTLMCASARMIVKRKDAPGPSVLACTLIPYSMDFELGGTLTASLKPVKLNHPHCSRFCVLGGASCSPSTASAGAAGA